jgi:hypothetical protein
MAVRDLFGRTLAGFRRTQGSNLSIAPLRNSTAYVRRHRSSLGCAAPPSVIFRERVVLYKKRRTGVARCRVAWTTYNCGKSVRSGWSTDRARRIEGGRVEDEASVCKVVSKRGHPALSSLSSSLSPCLPCLLRRAQAIEGFRVGKMAVVMVGRRCLRCGQTRKETGSHATCLHSGYSTRPAHIQAIREELGVTSTTEKDVWG